MPPQTSQPGRGALRAAIEHALDVPVATEPAARQRATLRGIAHAGLALDRYLAEPAGANKNEALQALYEQVTAMPPPPLYRAAYDRWSATLARLAEPGGTGATVIARPFRVHNRMIVGMGAGSVRETAITLHRLYGTPLIPGSALKGLAHHYAADLRGQAARRGDDALARLIGEQIGVIFGASADKEGETAGEAGYVTFLDAWYIPGTPAGAPDRPLALDVIAVHHPDYYQGRGAVAPTDFDDPIPTTFLSARGDYHVAVAGPTPEWAALAHDLLARALADWGIGGKTNSGYGRLAAI